jgi:uracil-DNA glycosylase family 4
VTDARELLARYLRQRVELGEAELVLERHTRAELVPAAARGGAGGRSSADAASAPARGGGTPGAGRERMPAREEAPSAAPLDRSAATVPVAHATLAPAEPSRPAALPSVDAARATGASPDAGASLSSPAPGSLARPAPDAPARGASAAEILALPTLQAVCEVALGCPNCGLAKTRTRVAFGEGSETAQLMVVGEAPGENEDRQGRPFVGRAGKLLDLLLLSAGFPRESVYICNVLKCRPPGNRNPEPAEIEACSPYLQRQIELVRPRAMLAFGAFAAQTLLATDVSIGRLRGRVHQYRGIPLVATYHPAALLRQQQWVPLAWEDLQRARAQLG